MNDLIVWMGNHFSPESYLFWTRLQCLAWTAADVVIVVSLIRLANIARRLIRARVHRGSLVILALTIPPAPLVVLAPSGGAIFLIELLVTIPHFLLILYLFFANWRVAPAAWAFLCEHPPHGPRAGSETAL